MANEIPTLVTPDQPLPTTPGVAKRRFNVSLRAALFLVLLAGFVGALVLVRQRQDTRQKAFSGVIVDTPILEKWVKVAAMTPDKVRGIKIATESASLAYYRKLTSLYPNTESQAIEVPTAGIKGIIYYAYEPTIKKTFIYSRIENLFPPKGAQIRMWVLGKDGKLKPTSFSQYQVENDMLVAYNVYVVDGNVKDTADKIQFSFDTVVQAVAPTQKIIEIGL